MNNHIDTTTATTMTGGHAALIAGNVALGSPWFVLVILTVLWLPVVAWTVVAWGSRHT